MILLEKFFFTFYDLLLLIIWLGYFIFGGIKVLFGRISHEEYKMRLGFFKYKIHRKEKLIWIHCSSVGEVLSIQSFVQELKKQEGVAIMVSTFTATGVETVKNKLPEVEYRFIIPIDVRIILNRLIKFVKPDILIIIETELWPGLIRTAKDNNLYMCIVNGRLGEKSTLNYKKIKRIMGNMLNKFEFISTDSDVSYERFRELGVLEEKLYNYGNIKFDNLKMGKENNNQTKEYYNLDENDFVIVAGSTHDGEELGIFEIYKELKNKYSNLKLVIAPRHIDRVENIIADINHAGFELKKYTEFNKCFFDILIVDTLGELNNFYSIADIAFVGGSLIKRGGHNIMEPIAKGKLTLWGPYMFNFKYIENIMEQHKIGEKVGNFAELKNKIEYFINNRDVCFNEGKRGQKVFKIHKGASQKNTEKIMSLILKKYLQ